MNGIAGPLPFDPETRHRQRLARALMRPSTPAPGQANWATALGQAINGFGDGVDEARAEMAAGRPPPPTLAGAFAQHFGGPAGQQPAPQPPAPQPTSAPLQPPAPVDQAMPLGQALGQPSPQGPMGNGLFAVTSPMNTLLDQLRQIGGGGGGGWP